MSKTFYRTVYQIEVLSEAPFNTVTELTLAEIAYEITDGDMNGNVRLIAEDEPIDAPTAARLMIESGSDPEFFGIDADGNEVER